MRIFLILFITIWMFGCNDQNSSDSATDTSMPHPKDASDDIAPPLPPAI